MDGAAMAIDIMAQQHKMLSVASSPRESARSGLKKASSMDSDLAALSEQTAAGGEKASWGRWTASEHEAFLTGLKIYGREWKKVATCIPTRTAAQIRSHAQKYFARVSKEKQQLELSALKLQSLAADDNTAQATASEIYTVHAAERLPQQSLTVMSILERPSSAEFRVSKTLASLRTKYAALEAELMQHSRGSSPDSASVDCPATAALAVEQKSLREAAEARYELKKHSPPSQTKHQIEIPTELNAIPHVSLASMPSRSSGVFDSSQVLALSQVCSNFSTEQLGNRSISTVKDEKRSASLRMIREQLMKHDRPTKIQKRGHSSV